MAGFGLSGVRLTVLLKSCTGHWMSQECRCNRQLGDQIEVLSPKLLPRVSQRPDAAPEEAHLQRAQLSMYYQRH